MARFRNKRIGNIAIKSPGMDFLRGNKSIRVESSQTLHFLSIPTEREEKKRRRRKKGIKQKESIKEKR